MEIKRYRKTIFYFIISVVSTLILTFSFHFFLDKYYKENIFIEINEAYSNQNFIFYNNRENKEEEQNIDFYKELNDAEKTLLSTNPFSEVYKLNTCKQDYKIQNEGFYNILDTCKTIYYCSDKTFAPMEYLNTQEENINTTNFDCILVKKDKIRKLYPKTKINLDQFIDAYCLTQIVKTNEHLNNFYLQKDEEIYVSGDQNKFIKGWNLMKKIIITQKTISEEEEDNSDIEFKNIDINELDKKIEKLITKTKDTYINIQNDKFDFLTFVKRINDSLDLLNAIALKFKILKARQKEQNKTNINNEKVFFLKINNIKNKAISIVEGKNINKNIKKQYALPEDNKKEKCYDIKNYFVNARTKRSTEQKFFLGIVFADNNILAKALAGSFIIDNFENANDIINNLRYHDCQYFVLFMDENGDFNYENSTKLKVKKIENNYEISFYE